MFDRILVLCTGNICRSPIAEALMKVRSAKKDRMIISAGTGALVDAPADAVACRVASQHGIDLAKHRAQQATPALLDAADLILVMDSGHLDWVRRTRPQLIGRAHKILKWNKDADVADPYGESPDFFQGTYEQIELGVRQWLLHIGAH